MNNNKQFADVILPLPLNQLFTFSIPVELTSEIEKGKRVIVQFGSRKIYTAIVFEVHNRLPDIQEIKSILSVLDNSPIVNEYQFSLWQWIGEYYMCSLGEVYKAALPSGLKLESETQVIYNSEFIDSDKLSKPETAFLDYLSRVNTASLQEVSKAINMKNILAIALSLLQKNAISINELLKETYKTKTESHVGLHSSIQTEEELNLHIEKLKRAPKQVQLLTAFIELSGVFIEKEINQVKKKKLLEYTQTSHAVLNGLYQKHILTEYNVPVSRLGMYTKEIADLKTLSNTQQTAFESIKGQFYEKR